MANVTRIKAKESPSKMEEPKKSPKSEKPKKLEKTKASKNSKVSKEAKTSKKPFFLFRPFVALGRYLRDSWRELRQVRWPNRKATWKMVLAVFIYTLLFVGFLTLLDVLFDLLFNKLIG